jgi:hypothetical protein
VWRVRMCLVGSRAAICRENGVNGWCGVGCGQGGEPAAATRGAPSAAATRLSPTTQCGWKEAGCEQARVLWGSQDVKPQKPAPQPNGTGARGAGQHQPRATPAATTARGAPATDWFHSWCTTAHHHHQLWCVPLQPATLAVHTTHRQYTQQQHAATHRLVEREGVVVLQADRGGQLHDRLGHRAGEVVRHLVGVLMLFVCLFEGLVGGLCGRSNRDAVQPPKPENTCPHTHTPPRHEAPPNLTSSNVSSRKKTMVAKRLPAMWAAISSTDGSCVTAVGWVQGGSGGLVQGGQQHDGAPSRGSISWHSCLHPIRCCPRPADGSRQHTHKRASCCPALLLTVLRGPHFMLRLSAAIVAPAAPLASSLSSVS